MHPDRNGKEKMDYYSLCNLIAFGSMQLCSITNNNPPSPLHFHQGKSFFSVYVPFSVLAQVGITKHNRLGYSLHAAAAPQP